MSEIAKGPFPGGSIGLPEIFDIFFGPGRARDELHVNAEGNVEFGYRNETQARKALARLAYAYGWDVQEEVVVPGWGRIDLVLREWPDSKPRLIELKVDLTQPAKVRRAFQQCDGYGRWWTRDKGEACDAVLIGCKVDRAVASPVAAAYPEVAFGEVVQLMTSLATWDSPSLRRRSVALRRAADLRAQLAVHEHAVANLTRLIDAANLTRPIDSETPA